MTGRVDGAGTTETAAPDTIRTRPAPQCSLCGANGTVRHSGLSDHLFGAPGTWSIRSCAAADCGLQWLDPTPIEADLGKAYGTYYTHAAKARPAGMARRIYTVVRDGYARRVLGYQTGVGRPWYGLLAPLAHLHPGGAEVVAGTTMFLPAPPRAGCRLLEIGCGNGVGLARMAQLGWETEGVDFDPAAVQAARSRGLVVHLGDVEAQRFPDRSFDAVYLGHVLEHVSDPVGLLRTCRRLMKPAAPAVVVTPNSRSWGHHHFGQDWRGLEVPRHLHLFDPTSIRRCMRQAGFPSLHVKTMARGAAHILGESYRIAAASRSSDARRAVPGLVRRLQWIVYQVAERGMVATGRPVGEELLAISRAEPVGEDIGPA